jgi:CDP-glucose 4,6-dehydratase
LLLGQRLLEGRRESAAAWNFGPSSEANRTVEEILSSLQVHWPDLQWEPTASPQPHEATMLYLDHSKANEILDWRPVWKLDRALQLTAEWYRKFHEQGATSTAAQLQTYIADANSAGVCWVNE